MPKTSRRRSVDPSRLYHDIQLRSRMLRAYYDILNEDTDFAAALLRLYEEAVERLPTQSSWRDRATLPKNSPICSKRSCDGGRSRRGACADVRLVAQRERDRS